MWAVPDARVSNTPADVNNTLLHGVTLQRAGRSTAMDLRRHHEARHKASHMCGGARTATICIPRSTRVYSMLNDLRPTCCAENQLTAATRKAGQLAWHPCEQTPQRTVVAFARTVHEAPLQAAWAYTHHGMTAATQRLS